MIYTTDACQALSYAMGRQLFRCNHCWAIYDDQGERCPRCGALCEAKYWPSKGISLPPAKLPERPRWQWYTPDKYKE